MLDPVLSLAVSMHSAKGVYALLLAFGVSRSSAIPTGWDVVLDLIRKLAHVKGENCESDPEAWYKTLTGSEPDYSDILDQLTQSSAERNLLLRSYFEPTDEDREQGRKLPSPAHRAIATLVARGYVRIIVTTNFDRLMEQALSDVGVQPTVISTTDAVQGAMPLVHAPCTIIKIHGDYLDTRIRNTRTELDSYDKPMDDLLDRVFDEYGLVVCGWSAEWDVALRAAMERCSTHRFGTYWTAHKGSISPEAEKVAGVRRAAIISIREADLFFRDLADKIGALEDLTLSDPVSTKVAVARMKRYLMSPANLINLYDLVNEETQRVRAAVTSDRFSLNDNNVNAETVFKRLRSYEAELQTLTALVACGGHWATTGQYETLVKVIKRLADDVGPGSGMVVWLSLRTYPALLTFYAMGIAATANRNYGLLKTLFALKIRAERDREEKAITEILAPAEVMEHDVQQQVLPGREREFTPLNNHLFDTLRVPLHDYLPDASAYDDAFDVFEYLLGLVYCDRCSSEEGLKDADQPNWHIWGPLGRFLWNRHRSEDHIQRRTQFQLGGPYPELIDDVVRAGLFGSGESDKIFQRLCLVKRGYDAFISAVRQKRMW